MAIVSDVKCGRCDRRYSGLRARCPYCGARRSKRGKYAQPQDNTRVKLIIGVLLLAVLIVATMVLIFTSLPEREPTPTSSPSSSSTPNPGGETTDPTNPDLPGSGDVDVIEDPDDETVTPDPEPSAPVVPTVASVTITYNGAAKEDITLKVGEKVPLSFKTTPETTDKIATWKSSDENVFMVLSNGTVTGIKKGSATLTVTVDGVEAKCVIRVR